MKFYGSQVYLSPQDKETLYWLIQESSLPDDQKGRFEAKLGGFYLNEKTMSIGFKTQASNSRRWKERWEEK